MADYWFTTQCVASKETAMHIARKDGKGIADFNARLNAKVAAEKAALQAKVEASLNELVAEDNATKLL